MEQALSLSPYNNSFGRCRSRWWQRQFLGVFIALIIIQTISNGMVLLDVPVFMRTVVKGALLVLVIAIDALRNRKNLQLY